MEITEEQRKRAETNRLVALAKRKAFIESSNQNRIHHQQQEARDPWAFFKCRKISPQPTHFPKPPQNVSSDLDSDTQLGNKFRVRLEISAPDSFSATPKAVKGYTYPGEEECLRRLTDCLSNVMPSHYTQCYGGGKACVYKLKDYDMVVKCLKASKTIEFEEIPWGTFNVVERLSHSSTTERWIPCRPEHLSDDEVDELIGKLPKMLLDALLPFQLDGIRFGLRRGGRCLIADEMGLGKTLQAIAMASCFMNEGSILVVCPAILRFPWAEELERWLPFCLPSDIHLVFGRRSNPAHLRRCPRIVVISYTMLHRLRKSMLEREWAFLIVDESHHVRCTKKRSEPGEIKAVLDLATKVNRIVLLSGTPSLSRPYDIFHQINMLWPGLLGKDKYEFAKTYCAVKFVRGSQGKVFQDFSKGTRLEELNVLLKQSVMIRRLKEQVLAELPPKRRQIIRVMLTKSDIMSAIVATSVGDALGTHTAEERTAERLDKSDDTVGCHRSRQLSYQELGVAKLSGFCKWLSIHLLNAESEGAADMDVNSNSHKMIIFAHHHKVLNGVQEFICEKGIKFIRIDGNTLPRDRQSAVKLFQSSTEVKIAIIGITAGGVGLDFSSARNVVFLELPQSPSLMLQAEDRAHRRGQTNGVNVYIFCAKDTVDESNWQNLNRSLNRVSSTTNGKYDAIREIVIEGVSCLETVSRSDRFCEDLFLENAVCGELPKGLMKLPDIGFAPDVQTVEAYDEIATKINERLQEQGRSCGSSTKTENLLIKVSMVSDLEGMGTFSNEDVKENASEDKDESPGGVSCSKFGKDGEGEDYPEKENTIWHQTKEIDDGGSVLSNRVNSLRFEVSPYTLRIHLYSCIPGTDSRPRPLFENLRQEELDSQNSPVADGNGKTVFKYFKDNPTYRRAILDFIKEWNQLRPIQRKKLYGKPLQLPLTVELCYLNESSNHSEGLLKGRSNRRTTPLHEISHPLPSNAVWKKVQLCSGYGRKEKEYTQGWTLMDEPLCKLCQKLCKGTNAKTPEFFEDLFCNLGCYEEYHIRTSNRSLRQELFQIECGICVNCQLDCHKLVEYIKPLSLARRIEYIEKVAPKVARRKKLLNKLVKDPTEGNAWHADHIVPVYHGGGECMLENMRTLCVACHYDVTAAQCAERRSRRVKAKNQLNDVINDLRNGQKMDWTDTNLKDRGHLKMQENIVEDELLVKVPGSAYSEPKSTDNGNYKEQGEISQN